METRKAEISRIATLVVALCTLVVTALVVRRELLIPNDLPVRGSPPPPVLLDKWEELAEAGHRIGPMDARLVLVEFSDFECPACAFLSNDLVPHLREQYPGQVAVVYRHWPLQKHRFSYAAARASECAAFQGGFEQSHDVVYSQQHLLGVTAGAVYVDQLEELQRIRAKLRYYPHDVWLYLLAAQWARIGQEEHFVGRTGGIGDALGSRLLATRLVHDMMMLCFLQEKRYAPCGC